MWPEKSGKCRTGMRDCRHYPTLRNLLLHLSLPLLVLRSSSFLSWPGCSQADGPQFAPKPFATVSLIVSLIAVVAPLQCPHTTHHHKSGSGLGVCDIGCHMERWVTPQFPQSSNFILDAMPAPSRILRTYSTHSAPAVIAITAFRTSDPPLEPVSDWS